MKSPKLLLLSLVSILIVGIAVQKAAHAQNVQGYVVDAIPVYVHSGPGKNYRIVGTVDSGEKIQITGSSDGGYSEIVDEQRRTVWIESKYVSQELGMKVVIENLKDELAEIETNSSEASQRLIQANNDANKLSTEKIELKDEIATLNRTMSELESKVKDQDTSIKKQWFFNGAIVLGAGLILGLIIPKLFSKKRSGMDQWK